MSDGSATPTNVVTRLDRVIQYSRAPTLKSRRRRVLAPRVAGMTSALVSPLSESNDMPNSHGPLRVGIGGPVGSGKTALMDLLCKAMRDRYDIAAITNDIYTRWDAEFLVRSGSLTPDRIAGVETGGGPPPPRPPGGPG